MQQITTDRVIVVGAGLGALYAALQLAPYPVLLISPEPLGKGASSAWAQGGVAAAMDRADSPARHAADTLRAGAGISDPAVATQVTDAARHHVLDLTRLGTPFDRDDTGAYILSREAAHSTARVVRIGGDQSGAGIMRTLIDRVRAAPSVQVLEGVAATGLRTVGGQVTGVRIERSTPGGSQPVLVSGAAYLLAGGGSGGLYALTTNPARIRGQVLGMAARAGAVVADAEFVQFHPTAIASGEDPAPLATEALRGDGAILINNRGERFMLAVHPDAELAPRDITARAIFAQTQAGLHPMLDTRTAIGPAILTHFPAVAAACLRAGIDPVQSPIPVAAAAHFHMGGVQTDAQGRTSLGNLWACGETSATGLHGANRLASNGLLEALVFARACAQSIADQLGHKGVPAAPVQVEFPGAGKPVDEQAVTTLRETMTRHVGVVRTDMGLRQALAVIADLEAAQHDCPNFLNMTATATLIAASALQRRESRGAHFREDYPASDPAQARRSRMTLEQAVALRTEIRDKARIEKEAL